MFAHLLGTGELGDEQPKKTENHDMMGGQVFGCLGLDLSFMYMCQAIALIEVMNAATNPSLGTSRECSKACAWQGDCRVLESTSPCGLWGLPIGSGK